jgi:long-chain acyl-CoA synthetase
MLDVVWSAMWRPLLRSLPDGQETTDSVPTGNPVDGRNALRTYSTPLTVDLPTSGNLTDVVVRNAEQHPTAVAFRRRNSTGAWDKISCADFLRDVRAVAKGLISAGVQPGDRVALMSKTRYEWTLFDYAIWFAGGVTVPVYETSSAEQMAWILSDSQAVLCIAETSEHGARLEQIRSEMRCLRSVFVIDDGAVSRLSGSGTELSDATLEAARTAAGPESLATLIYTSGTTGRPKGCCITHGNFMFEIGVAVHNLDDLFADEDASTLLFLPLAHVFARIIQLGCVEARVELGHSADIAHLLDDFAAFRPTFILAVPRVFEKVFNTASQRAHAEGRGRPFDAAVQTAIAYSRALDNGAPRMVLRAKHAVFDRLVYSRLRAALGGQIRYAVSGGAPLGERLAHFFRGIGVNILEGYGLTETTAAVTANRPDAQRIGSVGQPLGGTSVRVADDGELLFSGGQVFAGYWKDPRATAAALDADGWFHTGDVGEIDQDGYVKITGRKKEILVTAGGKNVAPAVLEDRLRAHNLISQCIVVGDAKPFVAALVTIDPEAFPAWARAHDKSGAIANLVEDPDLRAEIQRAVDDANAAVSKAESIRKFKILRLDWTEEGGHLTPSLKLKRGVVMRDFAAEVESLYT